MSDDDNSFDRKEEEEEEEEEGGEEEMNVKRFVEMTYFGSDNEEEEEEVDDDIELSDNDKSDVDAESDGDDGGSAGEEGESFGGYEESDEEKDDEDDEGFILSSKDKEKLPRGRKVGEKKKREKKTTERKKKEKPEGEEKKSKKRKERSAGPGNVSEYEAAKAYANIPTVKRPKKMPKEQQEAINKKMAESLLIKMNTLADKDEDNIRDGKPAIEKLKSMDEIMLGLWKVKLWNMLLDNDLLSTMARWLQAPKNELPDINIRVKFMKLLYEMPIRRNHLEASTIGAIIMTIHKSPKESPENQLLAKTIISKWMREVRNPNGADEDPTIEPLYSREPRRREAPKEDCKDPEKAWLRHLKNSDKAMYVRFRPEVSDFNFAVKPTSETPDEELRGKGTSEAKLRMRIKKNLKKGSRGGV